MDKKLERSTKKISDGNHTFGELYEERTALFCALCNLLPDISWKSKEHFDEKNDPMFNGDFIAGINAPKGIITFHIKLKYWDNFKVPELECAPPYDGYSSQNVIDRLFSIANH